MFRRPAASAVGPPSSIRIGSISCLHEDVSLLIDQFPQKVDDGAQTYQVARGFMIGGPIGAPDDDFR